MGNVVDFHTGEEHWSLNNVIAIIKDLIEECADEEEMKDVDAGFTIFEVKLLLDEIKRLRKVKNDNLQTAK